MHTLFPSTGSNWLKTSSENPWIKGMNFNWKDVNMFTCPCMVTAPPPYPILRGWTSVTIGFPRDRPWKKEIFKKIPWKTLKKMHISKEPSKEDTYLESLQNKDLTYRWSEGDPSQDGQGHLRMSPGMLSLVWEMELKSTVGRPPFPYLTIPTRWEHLLSSLSYPGHPWKARSGFGDDISAP